MKRINLVNKRFGRLKVLRRDESNPNYVICECDCGTICTIRAYNLTKSTNPTRSCGCIRREKASITGKRTIAMNSIHNDEANKKFKTIFQRIENKSINENNKSGHRGVYFNPATNKYEAYIGVCGKLHPLGKFKTLDKAISAREEAEEKYYTPLIAQKNEYLASL